jgi:hypothetical protein
MKKLTSLIIVLLIGIGILLMVLSKGRKAQREPDIKTTSLDTTRIHSLRVALEESKVTIEALQDSLAVMDSIINNNQTKVIYIKKKANEKANSVSKWSSAQFNEYLSDRYKDSIR